MTRSDYISLGALSVSLFSFLLALLAFFHLQPEEPHPDRILATGQSFVSTPTIVKKDDRLIFIDEEVAHVRMKNISDHRIDFVVEPDQADTQVFIGEKLIPQTKQGAISTPIAVGKDEAIDIRLVRKRTASYEEGLALTNIYREHGEDVDLYLKNNAEHIFVFGSGIRSGVDAACFNNGEEAKPYITESSIKFFLISDRRLFQYCFATLE